MDTEHEGVEPIAIIGMAARVPGAGDLAQFWRNLVDGVESITFYTDEEQLAIGATRAQLDDPSWVSAAPVVEGAELFDAELFGMTGREAELANPQHRLFLEAAHTALEDAGYDTARYGGAIGVYAGTGADHYQWLNLAKNPKLWASAAGNLGVSSGNYPDYVATLASYKLNLRGPSLTVHTACSTSMVALHLAAEALRNAECDLALAGGVCVELPAGLGYQGMEGYTSPDGHCRPFDARANGTLWGSGVGVVLLKPLSAALEGGDHIRAVIIGNAVNNDGSAKVGFSAPSVQGQSEAVAQALAAAAIDPRTVSYVEAHGTGTALGDPIEVAALSAAYGRGAVERQWCGIGSVKSNLGHLSQAAGIVGLIKTVLAMEHGMIPPTINFETPNPAIELEDSPFYVATALSKWEANGTPRRAGVSSFGIGGTNAHVVLEEAPPHVVPRGPQRPAHLLPVSARSPQALSEAVERLAAHLRENPDLDLADVSYTLRAGRAQHPHRAVVVAATVEDALKAKPQLGEARGTPPRVALLFPGQGAQHAGMSAQLYLTEPVFAAEVDRCAAVLEPELGLDIRTLLFGDSEAALRETRYTQPALFVVEYALAVLWKHWGVEPDAMVGHSIGEYVAATLAGVFELPDALRLVATRGRLMQSMPAGAMLAVQLDESKIASRLPSSVSVATVNGPGTCVVAGPVSDVAAVAEALKADRIGCRELRTSHAFHSPMMEPILAAFTSAVEAVPRRAPRLPFLSNLTGEWITAEQATDPGYWAAHLRQPVRFGACVATLLAGDGPVALVECGPGRQLSGLVRMQLSRDLMQPVPSLPGPGEKAGELATLYAAAGRLWSVGVALDAEAFAVPGRRVPLPAYPYQRKRHWVDPDPDYQSVEPVPTGPLPLDEWFAVPVWRQLPPAASANARTSSALDQAGDALMRQPTGLDAAVVFADGPGGDAVVDALRAAGTNVTVIRPGTAFGQTEDAFTLRPAEREDYDALVSALTEVPPRVVHAWALDGQPAGHDVDAAWHAQDRGFFSVLCLAQALAPVAAEHEVLLDLLSTGTEDPLGGDLTHPEHATLAGIARVLPLELPWLTVRRVDVTALDARQVVTELCQIPSQTPTTGLVALRLGRRWTLDYEQVTVPAIDAALREGGRYLVTGGLGGIGLTVAEDLATRLRARLVLVSRSGLPPRDEWDSALGVHGDGSRVGRVILAVRRMERAGASVLVVSADVTSAGELHEVRELAVREFGGLDGIVHAAGLPGGGMAEVKERSAAVDVLAPKLAGTLALRQAFGELPLDFVVLCSSVTGIAGGFGQVDYCAANAFLDAYARCGLAWPGTRVVSLDWGAWLEVGMAAEAGSPAAATRPERGTDLDHPLLRAHSGHACWGVISADSQWLLDEHRIAGVPVVPGTGHLECARAAVAELVPKPSPEHAVELTDVTFLQPLAVPSGGAAEYRVQLDGTDLTVTSLAGGQRTEHVRGSGRWIDPGTAPDVDLAAIKARCRPEVKASPDPAPSPAPIGEMVHSSNLVGEMGHSSRPAGEQGRTSLLKFGPRWDALGPTWVGDGEELAFVQAPDAALGDLPAWPLHPALLDVATSFGDRGSGSYLPLSYGRLLVREPLPARFYSHLRYTGDATDEVISADLSLLDEDGRELVSISDFVLRRVDATSVSDGLNSPAPTTVTRASTGERGIRPSDGAETLRRVLAADLGPQIVINTETVAALMARATSTTTSGLEDGDTPASAASLSTRTGQVAPRTELEAVVANVWSETLGVEGIGVDDDFFDLGGSSLVAVQLIARIRQAVGVRLPMRSLFETPTVAGLAERVAELKATAQAEPSEQPAQTTIPRLPRQQG